MYRPITATLIGLLGLGLASGLRAQAPAATARSGSITLHVDATDLDRRIFRVHETIPVQPGPLTLYYPKWVPGHHAPRGPIEAFAGLTIFGQGGADRRQRLDWTRDPLDVYVFRVDVPHGVTSLALEFQYASPPGGEGGVIVTPEILALQWERVLLYPQGGDANRIDFSASMTLPDNWQFATALDIERRADSTAYFRTTTLETLGDSPVFAGRYFRRVDLDPGGRASFHLNVVADAPEELEIKPEQLAVHRKAVREAYALFGSHHYDHYDFLLSISDNFATTGVEHHRSSENGVERGYFKEWNKQEPVRYLLTHEMTHSWNGKFRRPADLWTPDFNTPMQDTLLWVYEGATEYWGQVLAARSGLYTAQAARDSLAALAAYLQERRPGRVWRDLQDTTHQPIITPRRPLGWSSWQRSEDYYREGYLIWLDADTKIRELTQNRRSLDDFARAFFGIGDGSYVPVKYAFDDVVRALNAVAAYDWAAFLRTRLETNQAGAPLEGLERAGWKIVYKDEPSQYGKQLEELDENADFSYSIGLTVGKAAKLTDVVWGGPAFKAGLSTAVTLVAVNGREYEKERLKQALQNARDKKAPIELLVKDMDRYRTVTLDYTGGPRYPHLERIEGRPDLLAEIFKPRT